MLSAGPLVWPRLCDWRFLVTCDAGKTEPSLPPVRARTAPPEGPAARGPPFSLSTEFGCRSNVSAGGGRFVLESLMAAGLGHCHQRLWPGTAAWHPRLAPPPGTAACSQPRPARTLSPSRGPPQPWPLASMPLSLRLRSLRLSPGCGSDKWNRTAIISLRLAHFSPRNVLDDMRSCRSLCQNVLPS